MRERLDRIMASLPWEPETVTDAAPPAPAPDTAEVARLLREASRTIGRLVEPCSPEEVAEELVLSWRCWGAADALAGPPAPEPAP